MGIATSQDNSDHQHQHQHQRYGNGENAAPTANRVFGFGRLGQDINNVSAAAAAAAAHSTQANGTGNANATEENADTSNAGIVNVNANAGLGATALPSGKTEEKPNVSNVNNVGGSSANAFGSLKGSYGKKLASLKSNSLRRHQPSQQNGVTDPPSAPPSVWCTIKSKTRQHNNVKEIKKSSLFEVKDGSRFTIGSDPGCDLSLEDDRCMSLNARIEPGINQTNGKWGVFLTPVSRMYRLIGVNGKPSFAEPLKKGSVIKVGSISLEVIDFCTDDAHDFAEQFALELGKGSYSQKRTSSSDNRSEEENFNVIKDDSGSGGESNIDSECTLDRESTAPSFPENKATGDDERKVNDNGEDDDDEEDAMCYICWGGVEAQGENEECADNSNEKLNPIETEQKEDALCSNKKAKKMKSMLNPMIKNPCGNCSGCSKYVHLQCLLTWIKKSGSGHCTICNGVLPAHFASEPPNMELKIVRHRRGHSWVGTRRFRLSFSESSRKFIGNSSRADVRLPDHSVSDLHAVIKYDRKKKEFYVMDHRSKGGTFLLITEPLELLQNPAQQVPQLNEFKIGRTSISVKFSPKRHQNTMLNMIGVWGRNKQ